MLPLITATRYVTPLREGGSLPGIVEADDLGTYVVKFRGAGQGLKALVAEVIVGELARRLGLSVPELRAIELASAIARYEADEEVQDLLNASLGLNLAVDFLPGAFGYDASQVPEPAVAATILWLDAYVANVDRSWRNPNLLVWHGDVWCIYHGACLYFQHAWSGGIGSASRFAAQPYDATTHVMRSFAGWLPETDAKLAALVTPGLLAEVLEEVPESWLVPPPGVNGVAELRRAYVDFLLARLGNRAAWLPQEVAA
ncbi:MAG: HipA family kinase [Nocardioidaceae bacterium]